MGFSDLGLGFRGLGLGFRGLDFGFKDFGIGFKDKCLGVGFRVQTGNRGLRILARSNLILPALNPIP